ncbi:Uncharacterized protein Fot_09250 [Forsythia ovata]|uniref:Uncharacterized protein n=1 Tax=Forsythia ovata TaxID=205694 RepID=A0ABD1WE11_9LAMI
MRMRGVSDLNAHVTKLSERLDKVEDEIRFLREARNMRTSWQKIGARKVSKHAASVETKISKLELSRKRSPEQFLAFKWAKISTGCLAEMAQTGARFGRNFSNTESRSPEKQPVADFFGSRGCGSVIHSGAARRMKTGEREQPREE